MHPGVHTSRLYMNGEPAELEEPVIDPVMAVFEEKLHAATVTKTAYWQQKSKKIRKMGKSKARPGETMVYLTDEEAHALGFGNVSAD